MIFNTFNIFSPKTWLFYRSYICLFGPILKYPKVLSFLSQHYFHRVSFFPCVTFSLSFSDSIFSSPSHSFSSSLSLSILPPLFGCQTFQWFSTFRHPEGCSGEKNSLPILFLQKKFKNLQHCLLSPLPLFGSRHDVCQLSIWSLSLKVFLFPLLCLTVAWTHTLAHTCTYSRTLTLTCTHSRTLTLTCTHSRTLTLTCTHYRTLTHTQTLLNFVLKGCEGFRRKKIRSNKSVWFRLWKIIKHSQSWQISASEFLPK